MNSVKALVSDADSRKQWVGFLLIAKTFDVKICVIDEVAFAKNVNVFVHAVNNTISKNELCSELTVVAIRAWRSMLEVLSSQYDAKNH